VLSLIVQLIYVENDTQSGCYMESVEFRLHAMPCHYF
jgi:hypothetical protein